MQLQLRDLNDMRELKLLGDTTLTRYSWAGVSRASTTRLSHGQMGRQACLLVVLYRFNQITMYQGLCQCSWLGILLTAQWRLENCGGGIEVITIVLRLPGGVVGILFMIALL